MKKAVIWYVCLCLCVPPKRVCVAIVMWLCSDYSTSARAKPTEATRCCPYAGVAKHLKNSTTTNATVTMLFASLLPQLREVTSVSMTQLPHWWLQVAVSQRFVEGVSEIHGTFDLPLLEL
eukprot:366112-Chlamydomonas_euryale.AAC.13